mmetsp:Transcript_29442/g.62505  ORF Transcript_29442/g.62505 Transcript_29442/m.62505 type:complete len:180 (+) Transcript_29442:295-834(+)
MVKEIAAMVKVKDARLLLKKNEDSGKAALADAPLVCPLESPRAWLVERLNNLLLWYQVPKEEMEAMKKPEKLAYWKKVRDEQTNPPGYEAWTEGDEAKLDELKKREIDMGDTALGRFIANEKRNAHVAIGHMDQGERNAFRRSLDDADDAARLDAPEEAGQNVTEAAPPETSQTATAPV